MNPAAHMKQWFSFRRVATTALTRCTAEFKNKKAVKSDPGGRTQVSWTQATPFGVGIWLNGSICCGFHT